MYHDTKTKNKHMTPQHGEHTNTIYINTYRTFRHIYIYIYIYLKLYISRACFCFTLRLKRNPSAPAVMALFCLLSQNTPATFMRFAIVGGGRGRGYNNIQSGNRIGRVKSTERGITDWITTPTDKRQNLTPGAKGRIQPFGCIRPWLFSKVLDQTFDIRRQTFHGASRLLRWILKTYLVGNACISTESGRCSYPSMWTISKRLALVRVWTRYGKG